MPHVVDLCPPSKAHPHEAAEAGAQQQHRPRLGNRLEKATDFTAGEITGVDVEVGPAVRDPREQCGFSQRGGASGIGDESAPVAARQRHVQDALEHCPQCRTEIPRTWASWSPPARVCQPCSYLPDR